MQYRTFNINFNDFMCRLRVLAFDVALNVNEFFQTILILAAAFLAVFGEAALGGPSVARRAGGPAAGADGLCRVERGPRDRVAAGRARRLVV